MIAVEAKPDLSFGLDRSDMFEDVVDGVCSTCERRVDDPVHTASDGCKCRELDHDPHCHWWRWNESEIAKEESA